MRSYVTVVSGMPRSGTSLMMQMLDAGGIPALTDHRRAADAHNPRGYFEYEPVKRLAQDASWIEAARGKAVKIIYRLLEHLPSGFDYRVIFMERDLAAVFASQREMLRTRGDAAVEQQEEQIIRAFAEEFARARRWLDAQPHIRTLTASYADLIGNPARCAKELSRFLDGLDEAAMAAVVDPRLRHHGR